MIDLDHFKQINDVYGHLAGDEILREVARRLAGTIRPYDSAGRYGGEEFLLILADFDASQDKSRVAAIHDAICLEPIQVADKSVNITCSFGVSVFCSNRPGTSERLVDRADKALYKAKHRGRNCVEFDEPS